MSSRVFVDGTLFVEVAGYAQSLVTDAIVTCNRQVFSSLQSNFLGGL
jgi:hypothetical protein